MSIRNRATLMAMLVCMPLFLIACREAPTQSVTENWQIEPWPLPGIVSIGTRVKLTAVAIDSIGGLHPGVTGVSFMLSDSRYASLRGDTLFAQSSGYLRLSVVGTWNGSVQSSSRTIYIEGIPIS